MVTRVAPKARSKVDAFECAGDHHSMGAAQGRRCREQLERLDRAIVELMAVPLDSGLGRIAHGAGRVVVPALGGLARRLMIKDLKQHYPRQYDRMAGIARASRIPLNWLFVGPGVEVALNRVSYVRPAPGACTAIAVTGGRARGGEPMIAKNFDYPDAARDTYCVRVSRPARRGLAGSIDVTAAPLAGSHEGINEHGLAVAYNYGYFKGRAGARVPITNVVQEMLEECRTVDESLDRLRRRPRSGAAILMLADASGEVASVEVGPDAFAVRRAADHGDVLAHANHGVTPEMAPTDVPHDAVLSRWNPKPIRGHRVHQSSEARHSRAEQMLGDAGSVSERDLIAIASDHNGSAEGDDDSICRHGEYYRTTCSVVLFPQRRTMKVMFSAPCEADYSLISL
jgi:hypothetical protein